MDKTIFRVYPDKEIIALFPQIAGSCLSGWDCCSYMHTGQHGVATIAVVVKQTRLASRREYLSLLEELEQIGYNPAVAKRCTYKDFQIRQKQIEEW